MIKIDKFMKKHKKKQPTHQFFLRSLIPINNFNEF